ncbi:MAG TPA: cation:proton antiporter, partial [Candidatus Eremiobacteraeota bacterium]|nr:cation:proton antiporter [Candidatus Eremiobacteraeota bacterium]
MGNSIFGELVVILILSTLSLCICFRLRIPGIIGFFLAGTLAGPHLFGLVKSIHEVEMLAEIGVILLLFTIGIEFSVKQILQLKKAVLIGGGLQVFLTIVFIFFLTHLAGYSFGGAVFIGFLISLSSTAIVLKIFQEKGEVDSPHGRTSLAILIFQDIIIVPMMLFTPLLAGSNQNPIGEFTLLFGKVIGIMTLVFVSARWLVPGILYRITRTRSKELFLLTIVFLCFGEAWLTFSAGLSLALGAFLAGIIIAESGYSHQTLSGILPFRDLFTSFFFISIGMLLDVGFLYHNFWFILFVTFIVLCLKSFIACLVVIFLGYPIRTAVLTGLALGQIGEFSFILSKASTSYGLISQDVYQIFISVSILTMVLTPFLIALGKPLTDIIDRLPLPDRIKRGIFSDLSTLKEDYIFNDHVLIIGFGINGRNIAYACRLADIPYVILEMNPQTVREEHAKGESIFYGDATQEAILHHVKIKEAKLVVIGINDPPATYRIIETARRLNSHVYIIVRTRFIQDMSSLYEVGADEVIAEEFETSIEIFARVLTKYLLPQNKILQMIEKLRGDNYEMLRNLPDMTGSIEDLKYHSTDIEIISLHLPDIPSITGKSLAQIDLRKKYEIT